MRRSPVETGFGNETTGQNGKGQMVLPTAVLDALKFIPAKFGFGILIGAFNEEGCDLC